MKKRVVIVVEGGVVQGVACDDPKTRVLLFDYDSLEDPEEFLRGDHPSDLGREAVERYLREVSARVAEEKRARGKSRTH
jgi:hypothetical protein